MKTYFSIVALVVACFVASCSTNAFTPSTAVRTRSTTSFPTATTSSRGVLLHESATDDIQEKITASLQNTWESIKYRYGVFSKASKDYNFKQSMAIMIAGDQYDEKEVQNTIKDIVKSNPCVMFTWESSPSCKQAVQAFDKIQGVQVKIVRLDDPWSEGNKIRAELGKMTGKSSVPSIWIDGQYVGGYDAGVSEDAPGIVTMAFQGTLLPQLEKAGAITSTTKSETTAVAAS
jgi:glutaredoxin 3